MDEEMEKGNTYSEVILHNTGSWTGNTKATLQPNKDMVLLYPQTEAETHKTMESLITE